MPIQRLTEDVISMIAAGEVVERPASALKELIENALDSSPQNIKIELSQDASSLIEVTDDGHGIRAEELILAVQPHATSKLTTAADLETITTLGFRGEALASITALANLTLRSRCADAEQGNELLLHGPWHDEKIKPCVMRCGTEVQVHDLFIHAPARRKFMRKPSTEWAHCENVFRALAMGNPQVAFSLSRDKKERSAYPAQTSAERIFAILGKKFAADAQLVEAQAGPLSLRGLVSISGSASKDRQFMYLNGRIINDRLLRQAVRKAFTDVARESNIPYALFLEVPAQLIDVNAHPAKLEVRFREPHAIFGFVQGALTRIANMPVGINPDISVVDKPSSNYVGQAKSSVSVSNTSWREYSQKQSSATGNLLPVTPPPPTGAAEQTQTQEPVSLGQAIGVLHGIYLLAENSSGMVVIDIHAAHERILYEEFKEKADAKSAQVQKFIAAIELELSPLALDAVADYRKQLHEEGFYVNNHEGIEQLSAIPAYLTDRVADPAKLATNAIEEIVATGTSFTPVQLRNQLLATAACHAAVRGANNSFQLEDMNQLLRRMEKTISSGRCNHGRLTWRILRLQELDLFFERHQ